MKNILKGYFLSAGGTSYSVTMGGVFVGIILLPLAFPLYLLTNWLNKK